ncbi:MAG: hypothetical protein M5U34_23650 [Chloroflexi bacterium]|nr:hypothetical protein [Chloroflexota bacterium]
MQAGLVALSVCFLIPGCLEYYKRRKTIPPDNAPTITINVNALITGLRSCGEPEKYEIAPLETVFIKAAIIMDIPATSEDN